MIIVLLLFFQSICLYCQRLVLYIHDRWINPKNVRLVKEAAETSAITGKQIQANFIADTNQRQKKPRALGSTVLGAETCRFCANTPQGYCRHHFHLQERQLQQEQQQQNKRFWNNISVGGDKSLEQRQLRKLNREVKRNLKNRLSALKPQYLKQQQQIYQQQQQQQQHNYPQQQQNHQQHSINKQFWETQSNSSNNNTINRYEEVIDDDIGYQSASTSTLNVHHSSFTSSDLSLSSETAIANRESTESSYSYSAQHSTLESISQIDAQK